MAKHRNKVLLQCYFDPKTKENALKRASKEGIPLALVIRRLVENWLLTESNPSTWLSTEIK